jgi:hypothetical protein
MVLVYLSCTDITGLMATIRTTAITVMVLVLAATAAVNRTYLLLLVVATLLKDHKGEYNQNFNALKLHCSHRDELLCINHVQAHQTYTCLLLCFVVIVYLTVVLRYTDY